MQSSEARCVLEEPLDWADGFLVVYNISDRTSFLNAKGVLRQIRETRANCKGSEVIWFGRSGLLLIAVAGQKCSCAQIIWKETTLKMLEDSSQLKEKAVRK